MSFDLDKLMSDGNFLDRITALENAVARLQMREVQANSLDEITDDMGTQRAGRFEAWMDTILRMVMSGEDLYDEHGIHAHLAGFDDDGKPTFWIDADNGKATFLGGAASLGIDGLQINALAWSIIQETTIESQTRIGQIGNFIREGQTYPSFGLQFYDPQAISDELITNGTFDDLTGWTKTESGNAIVTASSGIVVIYQLLYGVSSYGSIRLTDRITTVQAGDSFIVNCKAGLSNTGPGNALATVSIRWYDHATAGSVISTSYIAYLTSSKTHTNYQTYVTAPEGALSFDVYLMASFDDEAKGTATFDNLSIKEIALSSKLFFDENGNLIFDNDGIGMWPTSFEAFADNGKWCDAEGNKLTVTPEYTTGDHPLKHFARQSDSDDEDGEYVEWYPVLETGTYDINILYIKHSESPKVDIYLDDTVIASNLNMQATTPTYRQLITITDISVTKSGKHTLRIVANGTTGSKYRMLITKVSINPA